MSPYFTVRIHHDVCNVRVISYLGDLPSGKISLRIRRYSPPDYLLNDGSVFICGLATAIGHITHTNLGSLASALCVRTMRFLHLTCKTSLS